MVYLRTLQNFAFQSALRRFVFWSGDFHVSKNRSKETGIINIWAKSEFNEPIIIYLKPMSNLLRSFTHAKNPVFSTIRKMSNSGGASGSKVNANRLNNERSPYLLQHANNPVDWYPWGEEAFEKARKENKLIFLSVGYSTCHWCHVMEKESFENESVAEIMNKHFVNVKVDREERPDVDRMYMAFVQATTGGGGWPMSVFLTPDLEPLAGGTYFPPEDMFGRPGFKTVLKNIADQWKSRQSMIKQSGKHTVEVLKKVYERDQVSSLKLNVPSIDNCDRCLAQLIRNYDDEYGGFSVAPKFPQPSNFNFLFHMYSKNKDSEKGKTSLEMALQTLQKMAYGGIHDHVNCGFARYSVDRKWHVPHFEKMLYDQGQLVVSYCDAYVVTKDEFYADVVRDILTYVSRDLSHPLGGFYGAEDADSYPHAEAKHKQEGAFCVWKYSEIETLIEDASERELFCYHYNVKPGGNVDPAQDPHKELKGKNVLACFGSYEETSEKFGMTIDQVKEVLGRCHKVLYEVRQTKPKPHVDTKIVTSWNGLMMSGYAKAGFALKDQTFTNRAILAANFIRKYLFDEEQKRLLRCCYGVDGRVVQISAPINGFLDDYAFFIRGLLDLYEASLDTDWLQWAEMLQESQDRQFWDPNGSGYYTSPEGDTSILIRGKEDQDGAEPCGNSVSVHNLIRLAAYLDREDLKVKAGRTLSAFADKLSAIPIALPEMASALLFYYESPTQVFIAGDAEDNNT
ncbi:spermatogenesis-associated protein 20, partial [Agrilus planipennis]|uniref:Spermatogenesis-associated protein 20 n=1 Tax=Agrilus planipennis TaxID=224129 RepID=A0A1W4WG18_AGRPL